LILLDCCASGGSGGNAEVGNKELIAACGFETFCPAPGEHSFTEQLIQELEALSRGPPFTTVHLHHKISERLKHWNPHYNAKDPVRLDRDGQDVERRKAPVHLFLNSGSDNSSIVLKALSPHSSTLNSDGLEGSAANPRKRARSTDFEDISKHKILIPVLVGEDYRDNVETFSAWIRKIPGTVASVHVEAVFDHRSTLLLVSMPVAVWDLLPSTQHTQLLDMSDPETSFYHLLSSNDNYLYLRLTYLKLP
jgi:hypothetical protein